MRLNNRYFCPTLRFHFNTVWPAQGCKSFSLFSKLLGARTSLASLEALDFQLLQKLDPGGIESVCLNGCLRARGFLCRARTSFNIQISASLNNPSRAWVKRCSQLVSPGSRAKSSAYFDGAGRSSMLKMDMVMLEQGGIELDGSLY